MSSNLSVINFAVGGTLTTTGKTTLGDTLLSSSSAFFQGLSTTNLIVSGTSTFNSLPTSTQTPSLDTQLTTKIYVDNGDTVLNNRITSTDSAQKTYIDQQDISLNNRITSTDSAQKTYIDQQDNAQFSKANTWSEVQKFNKIPYVGVDLNPVSGVDLTPKSYVDNSIAETQRRPIFYVYLTGSNTIANNTLSRIRFDGKIFNLYDKYGTVDYFFIPSNSYLGYYSLSTTISFPSITSGYIAIYKNGVEYSRSNAITSSSPVSLSVSTIMYFKSNTDSADVRLFCTPSNTLVSGSSNSFFTGSFIQNLFGNEI